MKEIIISKNDASLRLDKFLEKALPKLPKSLAYKYIRTKRIKVNKRRAEISTRLQAGDLVQLYINDEFFSQDENIYDFLAAPSELDIVYEDDNILLLNKPSGLLAHPSRGEYANSLIVRVQRYLYDKGEYMPEDSLTFAPALVNRIDRNTSGILIAAKNAEALRVLNEKQKNREIIKGYLCVVHGNLIKKADTLHAYLYKDHEKNKVFVYQKKIKNSLEIKTRYQVLAERKGYSLLDVDLLTGRSHQIRSHLAAINHPILGDYKYAGGKGKNQLGFKEQLLCANSLKFAFKSDAGLLSYLNGREFRLTNVWFEEDFYNSKLFENIK